MARIILLLVSSISGKDIPPAWNDPYRDFVLDGGYLLAEQTYFDDGTPYLYLIR